MRVILFLSLLSLSLNTSAQSKRDYVWLFGYNSNSFPEYPGVDGVGLNFNHVPVDIRRIQIELVLNWNYSGICDSTGNLLLYTNGCAVANGNHEIIENGNGLSPGDFFDEFCPEFGYPNPQGSMILPAPNEENIYFLFHEEANKVFVPDFDVLVQKLYLTTIDMEQNNGLGLVINKNQIILEDSLYSGELTAIQHTNGSDWWLMVPQKLNNSYYTLLITSEGVADTIEQTIGLPTTNSGEGGGQATFSPDGQLYIRSNPNNGTFIFNIDRVNGLLSNFKFIPPFEDESLFGGLAVSPNSRFLYVFTSLNAFQYDLWEDDIPASEVLVAEYDGFMNPFATIFYQGRIGPDCKIYINSSATVRNLHVIHHPNEKGVACGFEQHAITLPHNQGRTLPNLPSNFNLDIGPPCDTSLIISSVSPVFSPRSDKLFRVFPNPASDYVMVEPEKRAGLKDVRVLLSNALGEIVFQQKMEGLPFMLNTEGLASGIYTLSVFSKGRLLQSERVVVFDW